MKQHSVDTPCTAQPSHEATIEGNQAYRLQFNHWKPSKHTTLIVCNSKSRYFALPWQGGGGPFVVHNLGATGRLDPIPKMFQGHQASVQDLDFSPFYDELIVSASVSCSTPCICVHMHVCVTLCANRRVHTF
jgi:hypothetical protein